MEEKVYRPIIFSFPGSVESILQWRKTMTRRIVKPQPELRADSLPVGRDRSKHNCVLAYKKGLATWECYGSENFCEKFARYQPGHILWVRESFYALGKWVRNGETKKGKKRWKFKDCTLKMNQRYLYAACSKKPSFIATKKDGIMHWYKRPAIFMPKAAARIFLEVKDVKVERVQDISDADCAKEGLQQFTKDGTLYKFGIEGWEWHTMPRTWFDAWFTIWCLINGQHSWLANPWVFAYTFRKVERPGDFLLKKWKRKSRALVFDALDWAKKGDIGDNSCFFKPATIVNIREDSSGRKLADVIFDYNKESREVSHGHFVRQLKEIQK